MEHEMLAVPRGLLRNPVLDPKSREQCGPHHLLKVLLLARSLLGLGKNETGAGERQLTFEVIDPRVPLEGARGEPERGDQPASPSLQQSNRRADEDRNCKGDHNSRLERRGLRSDGGNGGDRNR